MIISLGASVLCDGPTRDLNKSSGPAPGMRIQGKIGQQTAEALRAADIRIFPRGNRRTTASFEVIRLLASPDAAEEWAWLHPASVVTSGTLVIVLSVATLNMPTTVLDVDCLPMGASVKISYTAVGGGLVVAP